MRASVVYRRNPFDPFDRRSVELRRPQRIRALAPRGSAPVICLSGDRPVMRAEWRRKVRHGEVLTFVSLPLGGGGGGSNPLRTLLMIGLFAIAGPLAGMITGVLPAVGAAAGGSLGFAFSATRFGIVLAGSALINAVVPMAKVQTNTPSPTYTLTAQGNQARVEQVIPVQYGRMLSYPDFAAQPYWEYGGQEQYLYHLLCLGCGEYAVEDIRIEDTSISAFEEITYEVVPPGSQVTLFPTSVVTSVEVSGQELTGQGPGTWTRSGTTITVTRVAHGNPIGRAKRLDFTTGGATSDVYVITGVPTADTFTVTAPAVGTSGNVNISNVLGGIDGFAASGVGTQAYKIGIDLVIPTGLYHRTGSGRLTAQSVSYLFEARQVDDLGAPIGAWITLEAATITDRTVTPVRNSMTYNLATPGRYRVRAWRTNGSADPATNGDQTLWAGLRAYMAEPATRPAVTLVAVKMRATNNLSLQASRKIGVLATRKLPIWNGTSWSAPTVTASLAWAIADAARDTAYGAAMADSRIDLAALRALAEIWQGRGDEFNFRFDQGGSWWDAVQTIAAAGRAKCFMQGGVLRTVRDQQNALPVALFSMRNIKKGSFGIDYLMQGEDTADAVQATYWDSSTWAPQRVTGKAPGSTAAKPAKINLPGVTDRGQGLREATYHAYANKYRRRIVKFATEMEGFLPAFGDLISIQHDMAGWGAQAEATAWNAATLTLTLSEPVTVTGTTVIGLRRPNGSIDSPYPVTAGAAANQVVLASAPDFTPETAGQTRERTHVVIGAVNKMDAIVLSVTPRSLSEVEIEAVTDDVRVYGSDTGLVPPAIPVSALQRRQTRPVVSGLFARMVPDEAGRATFGWQPAAGATSYEIEMAEGDNVADPDTGWTRAADTASSQITLRLMHSNYTMIRIRAVGQLTGPWIYATIGELIPDFWLSDGTAFWASDPTPFWST